MFFTIMPFGFPNFSSSNENKLNVVHGQDRFNIECELKTQNNIGFQTIPSINFDKTENKT